jgi:hypothetical protein
MRISVLLQPAEDLLLEDEGFPQRLKSAYQKHGLDPELDCHSIAAAVHKTHPGRYQFYIVHHKDDKDASMPWHTFMGDPKADKVFDGSGEMTGTHLAKHWVTKDDTISRVNPRTHPSLNMHGGNSKYRNLVKELT